MSHLHVWRWLRAEHEFTAPFVLPYFILDALETVLSIQDDLKTLTDAIAGDVATIATGLDSFKGVISSYEQEHNIDLSALKAEADTLHNLAQGVAAATAAASAQAPVVSAPVDVPAPAESTATAAAAPADVPAPAPAAADAPATTPAPADSTVQPGVLSADVQVGPPAADATAAAPAAESAPAPAADSTTPAPAA